MPLSEQDLLQVLDMFQKSGWQGMQLQSGTRRLVVSKNGCAPFTPPIRSPDEVRVQALPSPVQSGTSSGLRNLPAVPAPAATIDPRWVAVKAPMLGTFYSAPKPGAPPFVTVGQSVSADDTVGILEVMKLMNYLKAGVAGKIMRIDAVNGDLAEFDQVLFMIDPTRGDAAGSEPTP